MGAVLVFVTPIVAPVGIQAIVDRLSKPTPTEIALMRPIGQAGPTKHFRIRKVTSGKCISTSVADSGDAYAARCFLSDDLLDPCWRTGAKQMLCVDTPWTREATVVNVTEQRFVRQKGQGARQDPWAVELSNGERCLHSEGGTQQPVAGTIAKYSCGDGHLIGSPRQTTAAWRAPFVRAGGTAAIEVEVLRAWY